MAHAQDVNTQFDSAPYGDTEEGFWNAGPPAQPELNLWMNVVRQVVLEETMSYFKTADFAFLCAMVGLDHDYMLGLIEHDLPAMRKRLRVRSHYIRRETLLTS